jgi:hypothetical protein
VAVVSHWLHCQEAAYAAVDLQKSDASGGDKQYCKDRKGKVVAVHDDTKGFLIYKSYAARKCLEIIKI